MLLEMPTVDPRTKIAPLAISCAAAFVLVNVFFYVMSAGYFDSHREVVAGVGTASSYSPAQMTHVRVVFAILAAVVAAVAFVSVLKPRELGHLIPIPFGLIYVVSAFPALASSKPPVLGISLLLAGALMLVLTWQSYRHRSRAAWAFLIALCCAFGFAEIFGAPKVAHVLDISMWTALIAPALKVIAVVALSSVRDDYLESAPATA